METVETIKSKIASTAQSLGLSLNSEPRDAIEILAMQHRDVEGLFDALEETTARARKRREELTELLLEKLTIHTQIEEQIFYPAARAADATLILEAYLEHDNVKMMMKKIERADVSTDEFSAMLCVLRDLIDHHVKEEENELFGKCKKILGDEELQILGEQMRAAMDRRLAPKARKPIKAASTRKNKRR